MFLLNLPVPTFSVLTVILDTILSFYVSYKVKLALNKPRILAEGSLIVVLAIKFHFKLFLTRDKRTSLV